MFYTVDTDLFSLIYLYSPILFPCCCFFLLPSITFFSLYCFLSVNSSCDKYFQFIFLKTSLFCLHFFLYFSMYVCESHSVMSNSLRPHGLQSPWNSLGQNTGVGSLSLLQRIFLTQELNQSLLHYRQILYHLSYQGRIQYQ